MEEAKREQSLGQKNKGCPKDSPGESFIDRFQPLTFNISFTELAYNH